MGIITYRDIISLLGEQTQSEIPVYIIGLPEDPHFVMKFPLLSNFWMR